MVRDLTKIKIPFLIFVTSYILGIVSGRYLSFKFSNYFFIIAVLFLLLSIFYYKKKILFFIFISLTLFFYGAAIYPLSLKNPLKSIIKEKKEYRLRGLVISPPKEQKNRGFLKWKYQKRTKFVCLIEEIFVEKRWQKVKSKLLIHLYTQHSFPLIEGEAIETKGYFFAPSPPSNPHQFDYQIYLQYQDIFYLCSIKGKENLKKIPALNSHLKMIRSRVKKFLGKQLTFKLKGTEEKELLLGMILGERHRISLKLKDIFKKTNTMHILAISGLHLGMITFIIISVLSLFILQKRKIFIITIFCLIGYVSLIGFRPPVTRTLIMILVFLLGRLINHEGNIINSLSFAGFLIILFRPLDLFNAGFQLSFIIVLFIIILTPKIEHLFLRLFFKPTILKKKKISRKIFYLNRFFSASLSAQIACIPLMLFYYNIFSPLSLLANLVVIPLMYPILFLSFFSISLGLISKTVLLILNSINSSLISTLIWVIKIVGNLHLSFFYLPAMPLLLIISYYLALLLLCRRKYRKYALIIFVLIFIFWSSSYLYRLKKFKAVFFDVGNGEAALIHFPQGKNILIDCGSSSYDNIGRWIILPYLRGEGINNIDIVILTHFHRDHVNGLFALLDEVSIDQVWINNMQSPSPLKTKLLQAIRDKKIDIVILNDSSPWEKIEGEIKGKILSPPPRLFHSNNTDLIKNENSLVIKLNYKNLSFLFCGDIDKKGVNYLSLKEDNLKSTFIKVPHHGGQASFSKKFYRRVDPEIAIISSKRKPSKKIITYFREKKIQKLSTNQDGAIIISLNKGRYHVKTARKKRKELIKKRPSL
ncbi:DNA internalization-related competence protein ComEC/Rec2 [Candidatus Auribacterota bacterium]